MSLASSERTFRDEGATLPLFALMALVLFGMVGFAVDLGWVYLNASRVQNASDAAALAAVTRLPTVTPTIAGSEAEDLAYELANVNGYPATEVTVANTLRPNGAINRYQVKVTVADDVPTFFARVFGIDSMRVSRTAIAESLPPIALGGQSATFGDGANGFWAAINAGATNYEHGDPFNGVGPSGTWNGTGTDSIRANRSTTGYWYGVSVPPGTAGPIDVYVLDGAHSGNNSNSIRYSNRTGQPWDGGSSFTTNFQVHQVDDTLYDFTDNPPYPGCVENLGADTYPTPGVLVPNNDLLPYVDHLCTINPPLAGGVFPIHVTTSGNVNGWNSFGLSATGPVSIFGLGSMSLSNTSGSGDTLSLMNIPEEYAGRTVTASFYDAGDASGGTTMQVNPADANISCEITRYDNRQFVGTGTGTCSVNTDGSYNGGWVHMEFDLPATYTCAPNCWWTLTNTVGTGVQLHDRTTWLVNLEGNPVHLIQ